MWLMPAGSWPTLTGNLQSGEPIVGMRGVALSGEGRPAPGGDGHLRAPDEPSPGPSPPASWGVGWAPAASLDPGPAGEVASRLGSGTCGPPCGERTLPSGRPPMLPKTKTGTSACKEVRLPVHCNDLAAQDAGHEKGPDQQAF